jgi:hypothetical protein
MPRHRPPSRCPVCEHALVTTGLGCPDCGTAVTGAFRPCAYCALADDDLEALRVFLVSRGNLRELAAHLGVSYPTARLRYADLLARLGFDAPAPALDRDQVLEDLAAGRITVDEAEALLRS